MNCSTVTHYVNNSTFKQGFLTPLIAEFKIQLVILQSLCTCSHGALGGVCKSCAAFIEVPNAKDGDILLERVG